MTWKVYIEMKYRYKYHMAAMKQMYRGNLYYF